MSRIYKQVNKNNHKTPTRKSESKQRPTLENRDWRQRCGLQARPPSQGTRVPDSGVPSSRLLRPLTALNPTCEEDPHLRDLGGWAARASVYIPGTHRPACTSVCSHLCMCDVNTRSTHLHAGPAHRCTHVRTHTLVLPQAAGLPWLCPWAIQPCCIQVSSAQPHGRGESLSPRLSQSRGASWWASTPYAPYPGLPAPKAARDPSEALEG